MSSWKTWLIKESSVHQKDLPFTSRVRRRKRCIYTGFCAKWGMHGDIVFVEITREDKNGKKREGEVVEIIERTNNEIIEHEDSQNFGFVVPDDPRLNSDVFISKR